MYRRITRHNVFIDLMVNRPSVFLVLLMSIFVLISAAALKILEQDQQEDFNSLSNVIWFTLVTMTTVGFGDMVSHLVHARHGDHRRLRRHGKKYFTSQVHFAHPHIHTHVDPHTRRPSHP
jgi:hypothetical protein